MDRITAMKVFNLLFDNVNGFDISMRSRRKHGVTSKELTYGEVVAQSFWDILDATSPMQGDVFYDLGCGTGKPVFLAALYGRFSKAIGVEILPEVYDKTLQLKETFTKIAPKIETIIEFKLDDIFKVDFSDADVIYLPSTCFDDKMMDRFEIHAKDLRKGTRIITLTKQLSGEHFKLIHRKLHEMTWGDTTVNIYKVM